MSGQFFINTAYESDERFDMARLMEFTDDFDPLTSTFLNELRQIPQKGLYAVRAEDGRPDLISYRIYGSTQYWWIILFYNGLIDPNQVKSGITLAYPSVERLEDLYFGLKARASK